MASTYVNDLRLNEMATGDESGNWGVVTNLNLELIGEALGYGTEGITTNADTHTTTVADGATDPGRAMYIEYTGTLDSACTITIAPNTLNRMHFIENGTSGSQNIIISQGSGANITIPPGDTKAVYLDGAGSGAAVVDAFASLSVVDLKVQDDLTVTDDATIGGTLGVTGVLTATSLDISGDIDVDGTSNLDIVDIDGAVDMASTLQVDGAITSSAGATITVADNSENLVLKSTDADSNVGPQLTLWRASGSPADNDAIGQISFNANDDGANVTNFATIAGYIDDASDGTEDGILHINSMVAGTLVNRMSVLPAATVFNEGSVDVDFRVESNDEANMIFVNAGGNAVGIGTATPSGRFAIQMAHTETNVTLANNNETLVLGNSGSGDGVYNAIKFSGNQQDMYIMSFNDNTLADRRMGFFLGSVAGDAVADERLSIRGDGQVGIGTTDPDSQLHVDGSHSGTLVTFHNTAGSASTDRGLDVETSTTGTTVQRWINAGTELARVVGNGKIGIGQTNPGYFIDIGHTTTTGLRISNLSSNGVGYHAQANGNHNYQPAKFFKSEDQGGGLIGEIHCTNVNTAFNTTSDYRLKENVRPIENGLDRLNNLKPVKFDWKDHGISSEGFIAHEVQEVFSDAVTGEKDAVKDDGTVNAQTMDYGRITPLLVKAMQEQQTIIEDLKTRIETLEG